MNEIEATKILSENDWLYESNDLYNLGTYISWKTDSEEIVLDGIFTVEQLEAIAWWMKNKGKYKQEDAMRLYTKDEL